jgi:hypothetical protein
MVDRKVLLMKKETAKLSGPPRLSAQGQNSYETLERAD